MNEVKDPQGGSPTSDGGGDGPSVDPGQDGGDAGVVSTFCASKVVAIGASNVILCADFDEPSAPLGAWIDGTFSPEVFGKVLLRGGTAILEADSLGENESGQRLYLEKPANANAEEDTGAKYETTLSLREPKKGLRISFDVIVTRSSPTKPLGIFWLRDDPSTKLILSGEDSEGFGSQGNVSFSLAAGSSAKPLYGATLPSALRHVELALDPDETNTVCVLSGTLNGIPLSKDAARTVEQPQPLASTLRLELKASTVYGDDGAAVVQYDNVLVRKLD